MNFDVKCYNCKHKRNVPGDAHIQCVNPDMTMTGNPHGIKHGWFWYPMCYDPIWMTSECHNFEEK